MAKDRVKVSERANEIKDLVEADLREGENVITEGFAFFTRFWSWGFDNSGYIYLTNERLIKFVVSPRLKVKERTDLPLATVKSCSYDLNP